MINKSKTTIIGGSNSAHTIIPLLSNEGHEVSLLTRNPSKWSNSIEMQYVLPDGLIESTINGNISLITNNPSEVIPQSNIIILSLPVASYREVLHKIAPFINNDSDVFIGTIYGQAGFNWMVEEIKNKYNLNNINYFAIGLIPWITRTAIYGKTGINYGPKAKNVVAMSDQTKFDDLSKNLLNDLCYTYFNKGKFELSENFLSLTLSVDNQIIHLSRLYSMYLKNGGIWKDKKEIPLFYRDYDDLSAEMLQKLDDDYSAIRNGIKSIFPNNDFRYMLSYLELERFSYQSVNVNIKESFANSKTLGQISTPVVQNENGDWIINKNHRFFTDDLYYGLAIAKWISEKLNINVSTIDEIIYWAQNILDDKIIDQGKLIVNEKRIREGFSFGIPSVYNLNSFEEIMG